MKLRYGKDDWLELEQLMLGSRIEEGIRVFEPKHETDARAALVATRAVARRFVAPSLTAGSRWSVKEAEEVSSRVEPAVFRGPEGSVRLVYREIVVRFKDDVAESRRRALLEKYDLEIRQKNQFVPDQVIVVDSKRHYLAERTLELSNELTGTDEVVFASPNFVSEFTRAAIPNLISEQWHLNIVNAPQAWHTAQGGHITVAILDDGVDVKHLNLRRNIRRNPDPAEPKDLYGRDFFVDEDTADHFDPTPKRFQVPFHQMRGNDIHGTPCAGVVASSGHLDGVLGIAPKAKILPVKVFHADDLAEESRVANAIRYASRFADILSCSWSGPISRDIEFALEEAAAGRDGKGCPIFCATGNGSADQVAIPARSRFAIAVGASTDGEKLANYSNKGPEVSVVAPSSGGARGIFTTDVSILNRGFNTGNAAAGGVDGLHTNDFGGTSSATPLAAGVAALVLSANPKLTRGDVRDILQATAVKIGPATSYNNGHSLEYGFGRVNAADAVAHAVQRAGKARAAARTAARAAARQRRRQPAAAE